MLTYDVWRVCVLERVQIIKDIVLGIIRRIYIYIYIYIGIYFTSSPLHAHVLSLSMDANLSQYVYIYIFIFYILELSGSSANIVRRLVVSAGDVYEFRATLL